MPNYKAKFLTDLRAGKAGELVVGNALKKAFDADEVNFQDKGMDYDLTLVTGGVVESFEVKTDFLAKNTGNVFFEYACNSKMSGLSATQADKWAIFLVHLNEILVFPPAEMFTYLQKSTHRNLQGGDRKAASGYVVAIDTVRDLPFVTSHSSL